MVKAIVLDTIVCFWLNFQQIYSSSIVFRVLELAPWLYKRGKHNQLDEVCARTTFPKIAPRYSEDLYDRKMLRNDAELWSLLIL